MNKNTYGDQSISSLKGADRVRLRPGVIFGSDGIEGCEHSVFEILSNSIDEAKEGYGGVIRVTLHKDHSITVEDFGRGIPLDYNKKEQRYNWDLIFCELYAGGKYNNNEGSNYEFSLGLNGLGVCATQYTSEFMNVEVRKDGYIYKLHFEGGHNIGGLNKKKAKDSMTGSKITWRPDPKVFTDINISSEYFHNILKQQAIVNAGIRFIFTDEMENKVLDYLYPDGIEGYVKEVANGQNFSKIISIRKTTQGRDSANKPEYKLKFHIVMTFSNKVNLLEYYHNSSFLKNGGSPDRAIKNALSSTIDQYVTKANMYTKGEKRISFSDIQDSLILVTNSFSTLTSYENQTKKAISNKFIQDAIQECLKEYLDVYFIENKDEADKICTQILINKRSKEKAEKTRINVRKQLNVTIDIANRIKKFVDCRSKDKNKRELYIVEGDSALGSCKLGRNAEFQGIMPIRGKILNCLKSDFNKIFKSEIIVDLLKVLGCGIEIEGKHNKQLNTFNLAKLRWNKVIICTDADVDGFQSATRS